MKATLNLEREVSALFQAKMETFVEWCAENWTVTKEEALKDNVFDSKPPGYREGYNAAVEGLRGALECWLEEQG